VPTKEELKRKNLEEAHNTRYLVHLGGTKMYRDLTCYVWWGNMNKEIVEYVNKCLTWEKVKAEH